MKLVVVGLTHPFRGGIAHYTTILCRELARTHDVHLFALSRQYPRLLFPASTQHDQSETPITFASQAIIDSVNPWTWLKAAREIAHLQPELVLFQWWQPFFGPCFGTIASQLHRRLPHTTLAFLCHNVRPHEASLLDRMLSWYGLRHGAAFIVHSDEDRINLARSRPTAVIVKSPHPTYEVFRFEPPPTQQAAQAALGLSGPVILFFGNIRRYKGLAYLLRAMPAVLARHRVTLLIVGDFYDERQQTLDLIADLGIAAQVRLVDHYVPNEAVAGYFAAADVVVLPYVTATQSGVIQIAYSFGRGVITTDVGGLPEVVDPGRTGLLVPARDPEALAAAILTFYEQNLAAVFPGHLAAKQAEFSWDRMCGVIEALRQPARS